MIETERLRLRPPREEDKPAFAAIGADPRVMEWLGGLRPSERSDAIVERLAARHAEQGWGIWVVELARTSDVLGWTGLARTETDHPMQGRVEVAWTLAHAAWGHGYATEAGRAALAYGFDVLGLDEIVSFTARSNLRSQAVMRRIGLTRRPELDFEHPREDLGPLRPHVVYALGRAQRGAPR